MAPGEHPIVQRLEERQAEIRERLAHPRRRGRGWWALFTGLGLGALVGGALAYLLRSRDEDQPYAPPAPPPAPQRRDDAIVLHAPTPPAPAPTPSEEEEDEPIVLKAPAAPEPVAVAEAAPAAADTAEAEEEPIETVEFAGMTVASAPVVGQYEGAVAPKDTQCPASHPIKGNISRNGELIFHIPGSHNYDRTKPEACFASEAEAEAAGFRKARS